MSILHTILFVFLLLLPVHPQHPARPQGKGEMSIPAVIPGKVRRIAYIDADGLLVIVPATQDRYRVSKRQVLDAQWSPDDRYLLYLTEEGASLYDTETRTSHPVPSPPSLRHPPRRVLEWSPEGERVLLYTEDDRGEYIWIYDRRTATSRILAPVRAGYARWLNASQVLLVSSCGTSCRGVDVISVDKRTSRPLFTREAEKAVVGLALSPDRTRLLSARTDGTLVEYTLSDGASRLLWRPPKGEKSTLRLPSTLPGTSSPQQGPWDPTGRYVAFYLHVPREDPRLIILDTVSGRHVTFYGMQHLWSPDGQRVFLTSSLRPTRDAWVLPLARPWGIKAIHMNGPVANTNLWLNDHILLVLKNSPGTGWTFHLIDLQRLWRQGAAWGLYTLNLPFVRMYPFRSGEAIVFVRPLPSHPGEKPEFSPLLLHVSAKGKIHRLLGLRPRKKTWEDLYRDIPAPSQESAGDVLLKQGIDLLCGFRDPLPDEVAAYALDVLDHIRAHPDSFDATLLRALLPSVLRGRTESLPLSFTWLLAPREGTRSGDVPSVEAVWEHLSKMYAPPSKPSLERRRVVTIADLNGDGRPELMLQHTYSGASTAFDERCVLSWTSGTFHNLMARRNATMNGWWVLMDGDGDGRAEMLADPGGTGIASHLVSSPLLLYRWVDGLLVPHTPFPPPKSRLSGCCDTLGLVWQASTMYLYMGDMEAALQTLRKVRESLQGPAVDLRTQVEPFVLYRYGLLALLDGNPSLARDAWQEVRIRYPDHPLASFLADLLHYVDTPAGVKSICEQVRAAAWRWWKAILAIGTRYPGWLYLSSEDVCLPPVLFSLWKWPRALPLERQLEQRGFLWRVLADTYDLNGDGHVDPIGVVTGSREGEDYGVWAFLTEGRTYRPLLVADATWALPELAPFSWTDFYSDIRRCSDRKVVDFGDDGFPELVEACKARVRVVSWTGHRFQEWRVEARSFLPRYGPGWETHVRVMPDGRGNHVLDVIFLGRGNPPPPSFRRRYRITPEGPLLVEDTDPAKLHTLDRALERLYVHGDLLGAWRILRAWWPPLPLNPLTFYVRARTAHAVGQREQAIWDAYLLTLLYPRTLWAHRVENWARAAKVRIR